MKVSRVNKYLKKWKDLFISLIITLFFLSTHFFVIEIFTGKFIISFIDTSLLVISIIFGFTLTAYTLVISLLTSEVYVILKSLKKYKVILKPFSNTLIIHVVTISCGLFLYSYLNNYDTNIDYPIYTHILFYAYLLLVIYSITSSISLIKEILYAKDVIEIAKEYYRKEKEKIKFIKNKK